MGGVLTLLSERKERFFERFLQGGEGFVAGEHDPDLPDGFPGDAVHGGRIRADDGGRRIRLGECREEGVPELLGQEFQPLLVAVFQGDMDEAGVRGIAEQPSICRALR